jgi:hypothetical protein
MVDSYGNNALHMAVIHDLPEVYDFAILRAMSMFRTVNERDNHVTQETNERLSSYNLPAFCKQLQGLDHKCFTVDFLRKYNSDLLTPLTLAAAMGRQRMFQHIMSTQTTIHWTWGPITAKVIPLRDFDERYHGHRRTIKENNGATGRKSNGPSMNQVVRPSFVENWVKTSSKRSLQVCNHYRSLYRSITLSM